MNEQGFHSRYAYDERGSLITYTNNICAYADKEMDKLLDAETNAATEDELQKATWKVQQKIHDEALWVPAWTTEFVRLGYWRWVRWPNSATTQFCHPVVFDPMESYLYWVDNDIKKETMEAKREGKTFEEVDAKLQGIMVNIFHNINNAAKEYGMEGNLVAGANLAGFKKVSEAMIAQGVV